MVVVAVVFVLIMVVVAVLVVVVAVVLMLVVGVVLETDSPSSLCPPTDTSQTDTSTP